MNSLKIERLGKWTAILTFLIGTFVIGEYLVSHDVESGTLIYFYIIFAGITNLIVLLIVLIAYFVTQQNKKGLLITSGIILITYSILLCISYYIF